MTQYLQADSPIDPLTVDGTELAARLNRLVDAIDSGQSGNARPATLTAGGIYTKTVPGGGMSVMLYDGTSEKEIGSKYGYIMSKPPAGSPQSITAGAPGDAILVLNDAANQTADLLRVGNDKFTVKASGRLGVGTRNPGAELEMTKTEPGSLEFLRLNNSSTGGTLRLYKSGPATSVPIHANSAVLEGNELDLCLGVYDGGAPVSAVRFYTNKRLERMVIDGDGLVGINEPTPTAQTHITSNVTTRVALKVDGATGSIADLQQWSSATAVVAKVDKDGNMFMGATAVTSDRRLKDNLEPVKDATAKLNQITGYEYDMQGQAFCWPDCPGS